MALQFQPYGDPLEGQKLKQEQFNQLNQTLGDISSQAQHRREFNMEMALKQAQEKRDQSDWSLRNSPLVDNPTASAQPIDPSDPFYGSNSLTQQNPNPSSILSPSQPMPGSPTNGSQMPQNGAGQPNQPPQGQVPNNRLSLLQSPSGTTGQAPQMASDIVAQHRQMYPQLAQVADQANQGANQGPSNDITTIEKPFVDALANPQTSPAKAALLNQRISGLTEEFEKTPYELAGLPIGLEQQKANLAKTQAEAQAAGGISPEDWNDIQNNNPQGIAARHNGVIPTHIMTQMGTMANQAGNRYVSFAGKYQPQIQAKQDQINQLDSTIQGLQSGDAGQIESAQGIVSSALKLSPRLAKEAGGQSYASELQEWSSGKFGNQSVPPELMKPLIHILSIQKTSAQASLNQIQASALGEAANLHLDPKSVTSLFTNLSSGSNNSQPPSIDSIQVGQVYKGFKFIGGDKKKKSSWVKA